MTAQELLDSFEQDPGRPAKWELLFDEGQFIAAMARRLELCDSLENPTAKEAKKPAVSFVPLGASIPVVHDWYAIERFRQFSMLPELPRFLLAGERREFTRDPRDLRVGILVAGGNAPGLNMVVDSIVKRHSSLATQMPRRDHQLEIWGYRGGYVGLNTKDRGDGPLSYQETDAHATDGCIFLKTLRGGDAEKDAKRLAQRIDDDKLDILYTIGGNGTLYWALRIAEELDKIQSPRRTAILGTPKTMDNDVCFTDATFGFRTAVDNAIGFIRTIHAEAESQNRVGVVELFGAKSGFVALHAGYASGETDALVIPEIASPHDAEEHEQYLQGLFAHLKRRIDKNQHAVIVVAEGALRAFHHGDAEAKTRAFDEFLNHLKSFLKSTYGARHGIVDVRPKYLIRGTPPNSFDIDLCKWTGKLLVDTALAGYTDCSVQMWQGEYVIVPLKLAAGKERQVQVSSYFVQTLLDRERLALLEA